MPWLSESVLVHLARLPNLQKTDGQWCSNPQRHHHPAVTSCTHFGTRRPVARPGARSLYRGDAHEPETQRPIKLSSNFSDVFFFLGGFASSSTLGPLTGWRDPESPLVTFLKDSANDPASGQGRLCRICIRQPPVG